MDSCRRSITANIAILEQMLSVLTDITDRAYAQTDDRLHFRGVGGHIRHCLDFYQAFLAGVPAGLIDYEKRGRDTRFETNREYAVGAIRGTIATFQRISEFLYNEPILVIHETAGTVPEETAFSESSIVRELQFLVSHGTHHLALIGLALRGFGLRLDPSLGVAPSTLAHWREAALCAR